MYPRYLGRQAGPDRLRLQTAVIKEGLLEQANKIHVCKNLRPSSLLAQQWSRRTLTSDVYSIRVAHNYTRIQYTGVVAQHVESLAAEPYVRVIR